ncbi:MAG: hypothetical protein KDB26_16390, partial [Microthrixaceae bacterium]|nr:hypothetical protein [Microthrixaceae bacterium]
EGHILTEYQDALDDALRSPRALLGLSEDNVQQSNFDPPLDDAALTDDAFLKELRKVGKKVDKFVRAYAEKNANALRGIHGEQDFDTAVSQGISIRDRLTYVARRAQTDNLMGMEIGGFWLDDSLGDVPDHIDARWHDDAAGLPWEGRSHEDRIEAVRDTSRLEREDLYPWERSIWRQRRYIVRYPRPRTMSNREWETRTLRKAAAIYNAVVKDDLDARHSAITETAETYFDFDALVSQLGEVTSELVRKHAERLGCLWFPRNDQQLQDLIIADVDPALAQARVDADGNPRMERLVSALGMSNKWAAEWTRRDGENERAERAGEPPDYDNIPLWVD